MSAVVPAIDLGVPQHVHVVGIGGAGMGAIAVVLARMGHAVSGSDQKESAALERLRALGVEVHVGHAAGNIPPATTALAVSTAIPPTNPEVVAAGERGIVVLKRADVLAAVVATRRTVAVSGTHGKTTTTSMLAVILRRTGRRPSFIIGGDVHGLEGVDGGAVWDDGEWFVVEADESDGTFTELGAEAVVVTNVEPDHLDHHGTFASLVGSFRRFIGEAAGPRVVCVDEPTARGLAAELGATTYGGPGSEGEWRYRDLVPARSSSTFTVVRGNEVMGTVALPVPGAHNAANATGALAMAVALGVPFADAAEALAGFGGVGRRFERKGERDGVTYVDDYAHNPGKVAAVLAAAKAGGWGRVVCVFQPHRYSRTADLADLWGDAFVDADVLAVTAIYPSGEQPRPGVTGKLVVDRVLDAHPTARVAWLPERADVIAWLRATLRPGDLCLTLGAGDLTTLADEVLADA